MPALRGKKLAEEILSQADRLEGKFRTAYLRSVLKLADDAELKKLLDDIDKGKFSFGDSVDARLNSVRIDVAEMNEIARQAIAGSAKITNQVMGLKGSFEVVNDSVIDAAKKLSVDLSTNLTRTAKESLRQIIEDQLAGNISRQEAVRRITMEVGLLPQHAKAVSNYRKTLISAGTPRGQANKMAEQYAKRLLKYRANMIARTEVARATGIGQTNFWRQMRDQGALPPSTNRIWITALDERACEFCLSMNGEIATIDGGWDTPKGYMEYPQASHPHCRCSSGITTSRPTKSGRAGRIAKVEELEYDLWLSKHQPNQHSQQTHAGTVTGTGTGGATAFSKKEYTAISEDTWSINDLPPAIRHYMGSGFGTVNRSLRETNGLAQTYETQQVLYEWARRATPMPRDAIVYRGASSDSPPTFSAGDVIQNNGFTSSTVSRSIATQFSTMGAASRTGVFYEITVPKGTRVLPLGSSESELLFAPTMKLKVTSVKQRKDGSYKVKAEIIGYERSAKLA